MMPATGFLVLMTGNSIFRSGPVARAIVKLSSAKATKVRTSRFARKRPEHVDAPPPNGRKLGLLLKALLCRNLSASKS